MHPKKKIAFLTGGFSGEAEISYKSAAQIQNNLDPELFEIFRIDIRKDGWFYQPNNNKTGESLVDKNDFSIIKNNQKITFDAVFIGIHGSPGEDGKLQGYFDMLGIAYTGCDAAASAITFNKRYTTAVASVSGIAVARSMLFFKSDSKENLLQAATLRFPLFVKPNNGGSSIGMSKIGDNALLLPAFEKAFVEDDQVLVEEYISGREFTVGVYKKGTEIIVLPITEIISENYFFDFEAKYEGKSKEITPADTTPVQFENLCNAAKKIFSVFNCKGVVRIDFIYHEEEQKPYMLEINTIPGQTEASVIPQQVRAGNSTLAAFYSILIQEALNRS
jgi:D-alanine-D-alanine ligase